MNKIVKIALLNVAIICIHALGIFSVYLSGLAVDEIYKLIPIILSSALSICLASTIGASHYFTEPTLKWSQKVFRRGWNVEIILSCINRTGSFVELIDIGLEKYRKINIEGTKAAEHGSPIDVVCVFKPIADLENNPMEAESFSRKNKLILTVTYRLFGTADHRRRNIQIDNPFL